MASDCSQTTVGKFCPFVYGKSLPERERKGGDVTVVSSAGDVGRHDASLAAAGIVIGRKGTVGSVHLIDRQFWAIDTAFYVPDDPIHRDLYFTYHLLRTLGLEHLNYDSAVPGLNRDNAHAIEISVPSLRAQQDIGRVAKSFDSRIDHNHALAANLESIARRLFKSWFVDFDPVRAKVAGEKPPGLADDIAALFPDRFVESELGEIPEGWRLETLASVARLNPDAWTTRKHPDEIYYLDLSNVKDGMIEAPTRYSWEEAPSRARRLLQQGDTIIGTVRPGNRSFALIDQVGLTGSTGFAVLHPASDVEREYLYLASTSDDAIERLAHLADGAAYPAVRPEVVLTTKAIIPGEEVMTAFSSVTKGMIDRASVCKQEANVLAVIRDLLLPRLISGKIRVAEAESIIDEASV